MQSIVIAGKLARDAEVRSTQQGDSVCSFTVAVDQRNGLDKTTNWWRVSVWGKRGEALAPYLLKGASVTVSGQFSLGEYDGKPQLNVHANEIALQGGRSGGTDAPSEPQRSSRNAPPADDLDDSIPFVTNRSIW